MKKVVIFGAGSDLGVHIDGARFGPKKILENIKSKKAYLLKI